MLSDGALRRSDSGRRRLPNCRKRESSPYGSRRGGRDDVSGFFGFIKQRRGSHTPSQSRDSIRPSFANSFAPKFRGTRGRPGARCTRGLMCNNKQKTHMSKQVQRKHSGLPRAMVYGLFSCSPRRDHSLLVTVAPKRREPLKNLTPAIGASGPHDFTVRLGAVRPRPKRATPPRPPHPLPNVQDDHDTSPLRGPGRERISN